MEMLDTEQIYLTVVIRKMSDEELQQVNEKKADNTVLVLPIAGKLTYNELHSFLLGSTLGFGSTSWLLISVQIAVLIHTIITFIPTLFPIIFRSKGETAALYTVQSEPWYYLVPASVVFSIGLTFLLVLS